MADHTADHEFGAGMGALIAAAGAEQSTGLIAQLLRESLDSGQACAAALAALSGHQVSYRLPGGVLIALGQTWREIDGQQRVLHVDHLEPQPSGRMVAVCEAHHPGIDSVKRAYVTADRFAVGGEFELVSA
ncbi:hypothetical protein AB0H00_29890 [Nocardia sp. NPDC023852]|uniref:hypothetical protein n=1 Tax=Nocardia sp. NPDC023852 TaxID=3154697 RepID=UPI0033C6A984